VGIPVHSTSDAEQKDLNDFYRIKKNKNGKENLEYDGPVFYDHAVVIR
jgi:hypothetical protein